MPVSGSRYPSHRQAPDTGRRPAGFGRQYTSLKQSDWEPCSAPDATERQPDDSTSRDDHATILAPSAERFFKIEGYRQVRILPGLLDMSCAKSLLKTKIEASCANPPVARKVDDLRSRSHFNDRNAIPGSGVVAFPGALWRRGRNYSGRARWGSVLAATRTGLLFVSDNGGALWRTCRSPPSRPASSTRSRSVPLRRSLVYRHGGEQPQTSGVYRILVPWAGPGTCFPPPAASPIPGLSRFRLRIPMSWRRVPTTEFILMSNAASNWKLISRPGTRSCGPSYRRRSIPWSSNRIPYAGTTHPPLRSRRWRRPHGNRFMPA